MIAAVHVTHLMHLSLLPIAPLLLLPFALVFFVVVFPLWAVAVAVLWVLKLVLGKRIEPAFRWVLTFGGIARLYEEKKDT
jgi:hypothetical protein